MASTIKVNMELYANEEILLPLTQGHAPPTDITKSSTVPGK
jgi:hypothetical protein